MSRLQKLWFLTAGVAVLVVAASFTEVAQVAADTMKPLLVQIVNDATHPVPVRDVEQTGRQSFRAAVSCLADPGISFCNETLSIPDGKLLVIETISVSVRVPAGQQPNAEIGVGDGVSFLTFVLPLQKIVTGLPDDEYGALAAVRLYVAPGEQILLTADRSPSAGSARVLMKLSGYLVDCGTGPGCPVPL
jgi:hypothetical protein